MNSFCLPPLAEKPLVSIVLNIRNGERTVRRCIEGVLTQNYRNLEFIVQDGASVDRTLEIIRSYQDDRIHLVSAPDEHPELGFFLALQRCRGEVIGASCADESLLPHAVEWALDQFHRHSDAGAIYGQTFTTDLDGNIQNTFTPKHPFTLKRYLCHEVVPCFASSFFRKEALDAAGRLTRRWTMGCGEFELWVRIGQLAPVYYAPGVVTKYAVHPEACSSRADVMERIVQSRSALLERWLAEPDTTPEQRSWKAAALGGMFLWAAQSMMASGHLAEAVQYATTAALHEPPESLQQEVLFNLFSRAISMARNGQLAEAIEALRIGDAYGSRLPHLFWARALCHLRSGNPAAAVRDFALELTHHGLASGLSQVLFQACDTASSDYFPEFPVASPASNSDEIDPPTPPGRTHSSEDPGLIDLRVKLGQRLKHTDPLSEVELVTAMRVLQEMIDSPSIDLYMRDHEIPVTVVALVAELCSEAQSVQDRNLADALGQLLKRFQPGSNVSLLPSSQTLSL